MIVIEKKKNFNNQLKNRLDEFSHISQNFSISHILKDKKIQKILRNLNLSEDTSKRYATIIKQTGWPPHNKLFIKEIKDIVEYCEENGIEKTKLRLNSYFVKRFNTEKIEAMLRTWEKRQWLKKRIPILQEAIEAHDNSSYYASVSTLSYHK